jgi:transglutaminase-like putative cysteine protease
VKTTTILVTILAGSVMSVLSVAVRAEDKSTGASVAWTSDDPRVAEIRGLLLSGELGRAERMLGGRDAREDLEMLDLVRRLRHEYGVDETAMVAKLRPSIPDVTAEDVRRWREAGELQHRVVDGHVRYFRREPSNLFRFSESAKARRVKLDEKPATWKLTDHLAKVIAEAEKSGKPEVVPVKHKIFFTVTIPAGAGRAKVGSIVRVWLPFPQEYRQQKDVKLVSTEPSQMKVGENGLPHRTMYYDEVIEDPTKPLKISAVFEYVSYTYYPVLKDGDAKPLAADWEGRSEYLSERLPHIALTPELRAKVKQIVGGETNQLAKARKVFRWVCENVKYCAEEEYGLIPSISNKAFASLKGDCGVQGLLFITMCRAAGVPARWQSGWETKPSNWNMHDWAEFYVEPWGWLPADPSYGLQKSDDPKVHEFYFGHQDSYRLIVNLDYGRPLVPPKSSFRSEPADFQRGEVEIDGRNLYFDEWEHEFRFELEGG